MIDEWDIVLRMAVAAVLGGVVGYDRELADKPAGIRTHMLVAAGAALFVGTSVLLSYDVEGAGNQAARIDVSRVTAGIVTGVGFLGAGAIIRRGGAVSGLTTAAGIWTVAAIGTAVAFGYWWLGLAATALVALIQVGQYVEARLRAGSDRTAPSTAPPG